VKHRAHRITVVIGALVAALAFTLGSSHAAVSSTIHAYFDADGHLMFTYLDGTQVAGTIPPGTYTVIYDNLGADDLAVDHAFHLSGPGINFAPAATVVQTTFNVTFTAGSTYTLQDDLHPTLESRTFVATNSGGGSTDTTTSTSSTPASAPKSTTKAVSNDVVGADIVKASSLPLRGTLTGAVSAAGKLSLLFKGKTVGQLLAGRYTFVIADRAPKTAFEVQRIKKDPVTVTGAKYVGTHKLTVPLDPGQWWFFSGAGKRTYFIVVK
jgi:hypothetical protein